MLSDYRLLIHPEKSYLEVSSQLNEDSAEDMQKALQASAEMLHDLYLPYYAFKRHWMLDNDEYAERVLNENDYSETLVDELEERFSTKRDLHDPSSEQLQKYLDVKLRPIVNRHPDEPYECFLLWRTWEAEWRIATLLKQVGYAINKHRDVHQVLENEVWNSLAKYVIEEVQASFSVKSGLCLILAASNWRKSEKLLVSIQDTTYLEWLSFYINSFKASN